MNELNIVKQQKKDLREKAKAARDAIPDDVRAAENEAIVNMITGTEMYENARHILTYVSFGSEVDTTALIKKALRDQKRVYVPRVMSRESMEFFRIESLDDFERNSMGIREPQPDPAMIFPYDFHISLDSAQECLVIVPGLAFDKDLHRIGYGGGYYDRFLRSFQKRMAIGVAFNEQIVDKVPMLGPDEPVDLLVTPERAYF